MNSAQRKPWPDDREGATLRDAMRHLVGGVSVVTAGRGEERTGLTVTSAVSLSVEPPTMVVSVNRQASAWPVIQAYGHFCVNVLADRHQALADRFAGRGGVRGPARYAGAEWTTLATGAAVLVDALAAIDCAVEETIERHSHVIVLGAVRALRLADGGGALAYWHGGYHRFVK